jgi:hypothetical protein
MLLLVVDEGRASCVARHELERAIINSVFALINYHYSTRRLFLPCHLLL